MKHKNKTKKISHVLGSRFLPIVTIATFAVVGTVIVAFSRAATTADNPVGSADFCRLNGTTTEIYGWAHDGQAGVSDNPKVTLTVGPKSTAVATNIPNYKDAAINTYLQNRSIATASRYGFKANFTGIYKGTAPAISGTLINVGAGANQPLNIFVGTTTTSSGSNYYFVGKKVPDACLPPKPAPPVIPPSTPATPSNPIPNVPQAPATNTGTSKPGNNTGTGSTPAAQETNPTTPPDTTVQTTGAPFKLVVKLTDKDEPLPDVEVTLLEAEDAKATTDPGGNATFTGLTRTSYTAKFNYKDAAYEQVLSFSSDEVSSTSGVEIAIDVDTLRANQAAEANDLFEKKTNPAVIIIPIILLLGLAGGAVLFIRKRRMPKYDYSQSSLADFALPQAPAPPTHTPHQPAQHSAHNTAGVSLKDMVIESIREENAKKHKDT